MLFTADAVGEFSSNFQVVSKHGIIAKGGVVPVDGFLCNLLQSDALNGGCRISEIGGDEF